MPLALPSEEIDEALKKSAAQYEDWVKSFGEQKRRLAYLQALEKQFLVTRDMKLLEEFRDEREIPEAELAEKVKEPYALWDEDGWLEKAQDDPEKLVIRQRILDDQDADARLLNPNVKIRHIKGKEDGHTYRVYEGIDGKGFRAFLRLRDAEREAQRKINEMTARTVLSSSAYCPAAPSKSSKIKLN